MYFFYNMEQIILFRDKRNENLCLSLVDSTIEWCIVLYKNAYSDK